MPRGPAWQKKYLRIRSFKKNSQTQYKENIKNHPEYIECLYEDDPNEISEKITRIICESIKEIAPVQKIQLKEKKNIKLTEDVKTTHGRKTNCT